MWTAFEKAGIDPDKPPKTWEEVAEYARKEADSRRLSGRIFDGLDFLDSPGKLQRLA